MTTETAQELILTRPERMTDATGHWPDGRCTRPVVPINRRAVAHAVVECGHKDKST